MIWTGQKVRYECGHDTRSAYLQVGRLGDEGAEKNCRRRVKQERGQGMG